MKLQDAYVAEKGDYYGSWKAIGYADPASTVFTYDGFKTGDDVGLATATEKAWEAKTKSALNDCKINSVWLLKVQGNTSKGGTLTYTPGITGGKTGDCAALTANYCNIGGNPNACQSL